MVEAVWFQTVAAGIFATLLVVYHNSREARSLRESLKTAISSKSSTVNEFLFKTIAMTQARSAFNVSQGVKSGKPVALQHLIPAKQYPKTFEEYREMIDQIKFTDELDKVYQVHPLEMARFERVIEVRASFEALPARISELVRNVTWALVAGVLAAFSIIVYGFGLVSNRGDITAVAALGGLFSGAYWFWNGLVAIPKLGDLGSVISDLHSAETFEDIESSTSSLMSKLGG